ncbi:VWA domain-containing protein [Actinoplanes sp. TBRC 11911]|uniref:vWA domain-containing protein n=1 Tax=Actinoplanes sp. TBRC 11911 TaxID=2729386 RepID=UPI0028A27D09|nr:VWA domain-containing protein [Actinoplanes sp. TBRC 11911]
MAFADRLRTAGVPAGLTHVADLVHALDVSPPDSVGNLYWTARIALVRRQADVAAFDRVFDAVFAEAPPLPLPHTSGAHAQRDEDMHVPMPAGADQLAGGNGLPWATLPAAVEAGDDPAGTGPRLPELRPSALTALAARPFEELDTAQTAALGEALRKSLTTWPARRTRRHAVDPAGRRIALRPTIARARRTGWEPVTIVRERPIRRPRRVVLLCDVSESMRAQATAYLHLMRAFALVADAEVFAFATTLTRLTPALRQSSPSEAIARATETVTDRFGGTRIATNIEALLASHHGNALRGGLVIVASDGWDSDPPDRLAAAMARLRRRAYRIFWLNPRAGQPGFAPRVASMAAALPFCDHLLPAATFADLQACAQLWAAAPASRP